MSSPRYPLVALLVLGACSPSRASDPAPSAAASAAAIAAPVASSSPAPSSSAEPPPAPAKPMLATKQFLSYIWEKPRYDSMQLGTLRAGAKVARGAAYDGKDAQPCGGTWYAVEPSGYVCEGKDGITSNLDDPTVVAAAKWVQPKDEPLPYAYGMSFASPMYARVPTAQEQKDSEGDVDYWRKNIAATREKLPPEKRWPELALPLGDVPDVIANHAQAPAIVPWLSPNKQVKGGYALPNTRLAFVAAFESESRNFYLTSEMLVVPADRFKAANPRDFQGVELAKPDEKGEHLPMVWVRFPTDKQPVFVYRLEGESLSKTEAQLALQSHAGVAEKDVMVKGVRYHELLAAPEGLEAKDGVKYLVRQTDVTRVDAAKQVPDKVAADEYWIDVDIARQTLVAYVGTTPTFVTLVTSGAGGKGRVTPLGTFRVYQKHKTTRMSAEEKPPEKEGEEGERAYRFDDVPWVQYVYAGIALHAAFWHDNFGRAGSHGCINLSPKDARYLFKRTLPQLPDGWHGVNAARGGFPVGTVVVIHV